MCALKSKRRSGQIICIAHPSGRLVRFPGLQKGASLICFSFTVRASSAAVSEEMLRSILCHISNRQPSPTGVPGRPTMEPALPFYLHSGWQPTSSWLSLIRCQRLGIQHPPRRNSLRSTTTNEGLGRSWETVYGPILHPITPPEHESVQVTCAGQ